MYNPESSGPEFRILWWVLKMDLKRLIKTYTVYIK